MSRKPQRWGTGDRITAARLNDTREESLRSRRAVTTGPNVTIIGSNLGTNTSAMVKQGCVLCIATEDFTEKLTDNYQATDKVPSGACRIIRLDLADGGYVDENDTAVTPFMVWDPLAWITGSETKSEGDAFWAAYNKDSQRLEVISGGGGGAQIIAFAVVSVDPVHRSAQVEIRQRTFRGKVYGSILEDSVVTVYDTDGCYLNEPDVDLTGRLGKATLMYVDQEAIDAHFFDLNDDTDCSDGSGTGPACVPTRYWNVISLCCPATICEA